MVSGRQRRNQFRNHSASHDRPRLPHDVTSSSSRSPPPTRHWGKTEVATTVDHMDSRDLFLASDGAMREVVSRLTPADLEHPVPADWSSTGVPTLRGILALHARDEAWVPDLLAGKTMDEVGDRWNGELLGDDPVGNYLALNLRAEEAGLSELVGLDTTTVHFSYGDYPLREGFLHIALYRAFQAWM